MKKKTKNMNGNIPFDNEEATYHYPKFQRKSIENAPLLMLAELIVSDTAGCQMAGEALRHVNVPMQIMAERLGCTRMGAFFLSWILDNFHDRHLLILDLAHQLRCNSITILNYWSDIEKLRDMHYIRIGEVNGETFFCLPKEVMEAFRANRAYTGPAYGEMDDDMFLNQLSQLESDRQSGFLNSPFFLIELQLLIDANPQLRCARWLSATPNTAEDRGVMAVTIARYVAGNSRVSFTEIISLFAREDELISCRRNLMHNKHNMQRAGWIEQICVGGQSIPQVWCLTNKAKEVLFDGISILLPDDRHDMIEAENISEKKLYFRPAMEIELGKLRSLLSQDRFPEVQRRLEENGMRRGVTCIFYGGPGTGKTESVLQLARETGRAIMKVDISLMRDKYVGESEKKIKGVFDRYGQLCRREKVTPILLFNEADAIFTRRNEQASDSTDKMENAMQNIILEEMEKLEGILIATTNLAQSLDSAFERRFLYKLEFQNPTAEESRHIWSAMIKDLSDEDAYTLASEFRFSGGQIENIARKQIISSLLDNEPVALEGLRDFCRKESLKQNNPIGFC